MPVKVGVVGAGIVGMATAVRAIESIPDLDMTILSTDFSPNTTGDGAAGFFNPYLVTGVDPQLLRRWTIDAYNFYSSFMKDHPNSLEIGIGFCDCYQLGEKEFPRPAYADAFPEYRVATEEEMKQFPIKYQYGVYFKSLFVECKKFLPYLYERFKAKGGKIVKRQVNRLDELAREFDIVVNCPGVQAAIIVPDKSVKPYRGQVMRVRAPWIKTAVIAGLDFHVYPNSDTVVLGGTKQEHSWVTLVDPNDRLMIWNGCLQLIPSLKDCEVLFDWVGLRPGRDSPRIEYEVQELEFRKFHVVHHYGHGGGGVTLSWGTAGDAVKRLEEAVQAVKGKEAEGQPKE